MINPPQRSPREKVGGLCHFGRMIDKIRAQQRGDLPGEYHRNLGLSVGLDGNLCTFLNIEFEELCERVKQGDGDEEILEWCFARGLRPTKGHIRIWNEFARKFGWNDRATPFIETTKVEDGFAHRTDLLTAFDVIDAREGREPQKS